MRSLLSTIALIVICLLPALSAQSEKITINEIMYHPASENPREEYIELFNAGSSAVNLQGWRFARGIQFTFPNVAVSPGGYLVVAADLPTFQSKYPSVANVVGGWQGSLSNSDEKIELENASGALEDSVHYASEGDWAVRARGPVDHNHQGWIWAAEHNGGGKSLELMNPALSNKQGQNWAASIPADGTPGRENSMARTNVAPMILDVLHSPAIPKSTDAVTVLARIADEFPQGVAVTLHYRVDGSDAFLTQEMLDDGSHGDDMPGDGFYGTIIPPQPNDTIIEFYLEAIDAEGNSRTWPGPTQPAGTQSANLLYQVNDSVYQGTQPLYLLIMTRAEQQELAYLGTTLPDAFSNAQMNGTFISVDESGTDLHYTVGIRNRGHGSRAAQPDNYHINFSNDRRWKDVTALNFNSLYGYTELVGLALFKKAGFPTQEARPVQVRVNNQNLAKSGAPQFGSYAAIEAFNTDFVRRHFPNDSAGNLYRGISSDPPLVAEADLFYRGANADAYGTNYVKQTNKTENDWSDLIELTRVLSDTMSGSYGQGIQRVLIVDEWLRYFALNALLDNNETGIYNGVGDDYGLYRGVNDPRFYILPYDLDTIMGQGDQPGKTNAEVFRATALFVVNRFLKGPEFLPLYYAHLRGLMDTILSPEQLNPLLDSTLGGFVPAAKISEMKTFAAARNEYVGSILPGLVSITQTWKYNESGTDLGTVWRETQFDDSGWPSGPALLYNETDPLPAPKKTKLTLGKSTYYFRTHFSLPEVLGASSSRMSLSSSTVIDDGAVVYLNGAEVFRLGMPDGPIDYSTLSARLIGNAAYEGPFTIPADNLISGDNVLAVEVHQTDPTSSDIVFGMTLDPAILSLNLDKLSSPVLLNEVFANSSQTSSSNPFPGDWVELYNPSGQDVDLSDVSLSDSKSTPRKWVFPSGSIIRAQDYLLLGFDPGTPVSASNTGFGLNAAGEAVYLFDKASNGGVLLDTIGFGLQPAGFSIGRVPSDGGSSWTLTLPTPGKGNIVATLGDSSAAKINEFLAKPVDGPDWFEIYNPTANPIDISTFYLSDNLSLPRGYKIPSLSFIGAGVNGYQKFIADNDTSKGADHTNFKLSGDGDSIGLFNPAGSLVDSVTFGPQQVGVSQGRFPDGSSALVSFPSPTPGESNFLLLTNVVINEVLTHTDPPLEDAIELYNPTGGAVDLSGWFLSDSADNLKKFRIPQGTTIPPEGFAVFYEYQFNPDPNLSSSFSLSSAHGDQVYLSAADNSGNLTGQQTSVKFGAAEHGVSFGRYVASQGPQFVAMEHRTFGADNPNTVEELRTGRGLPNSPPKVGPVVINELMYHTAQPELEFVELANIAYAPVALFDAGHPTNTWQVRGGVDLVFPQNLTLPARSSLVLVSFDPATDPTSLAAFRAAYNVPAETPIVGPYRGKLSNSSDSIELYKPDTPQLPGSPDVGFVPYVLVDQLRYQNQPPWPVLPEGANVSLQRKNAAEFGNDPVNWNVGVPTPGQSLPSGPQTDDLRIVLQPGRTVSLSFGQLAGKSYTIQARESLMSGSWADLKSFTAQTSNAIVELVDTIPEGTPSRFYRLRSSASQ